MKYFIIFFILFPTMVFAGTTKLYTDDDIDVYRHPSDNENRAPIAGSSGSLLQEDRKPVNEKAEAEYWCDRMTKAKDKLKRAQKTLIDAGMTEAGVRGTYGRKYIGGSAVTDAAIEENKAKDEVRAAQDEVNYIEEDARRKSIPPGWLYCNY